MKQKKVKHDLLQLDLYEAEHQKELLARGKKKRCKRLVIQPHHIRYKDDPKGEWVVSMYKGEHMIIGRMNWRKNVSLGFVEALQDWLQRHVAEAVAL